MDRSIGFVRGNQQTLNLSAEKLPAARLLPRLSCELKDVARHESEITRRKSRRSLVEGSFYGLIQGVIRELVLQSKDIVKSDDPNRRIFGRRHNY
jgi:hypothetical protein